MAGLLLPLAFAPFGLWWLTPLLVAVPVIFWRRQCPRDAAATGFAFGAGAFLTGTYWLYISIHVFGQTPVVLAIVLMLLLVLIMAAYYAACGALVAWLSPQSSGRVLAMASVAAVWTLLEWLRGWLFSGFPWLSLGYSQIDSPLAGFAPLVGVYGISFLVLVQALGILESLTRRGAGRIAGLALVVAVTLSGEALRRVDWTTPVGDAVAATLVQGAIGQERKWLPEERGPTLDFYRNLTSMHTSSAIVVWPEVAIPAASHTVKEYLRRLDADMESTGTALALGILDYDFETRGYFNSLISLGEREERYAKRHLVPFGEYFPVPDFVRGWLRLMSLPNADMSPGAADQPPLTLNGIPVAVTICYEDAFAAEQRYLFPAAQLIVNVSNDAWFGDSVAPHHHLDIARMRSLEFGRWQLRATNTGITAFIDPFGRTVRSLAQFEPGALTGQVVPRTGLTPYVRLGNTPMLAFLFCIVGLAAYAARQRSNM